MAATLMASLWSIIISRGYLELLLPVCACFFLYECWRRKDEDVPNWPIVGMLPSVLLNIHRAHDQMTEVVCKHGGTFKFKGPWFTHMDVLCTCDPANINYICNTSFSNFPKGPEYSKIFDIFGESIITSDSESWRIQRKIAHSLMSSKKFRTLVNRTSQAKVKGLMHVLKHIANQDQGVTDLQDLFQRFTFDNTCILVFGTDPGSLSIDLPVVPFQQAMDDTIVALAFRHAVPESWWKLLKWFKIGKEKKLTEAWKTFDHFINQLISLRREELNKYTTHVGEQDSEEGADLLTSYIDYQHNDELPIANSDKFLRDTTLNLVLAGRDTTSSALTWFFWLVSLNSEVESKILEEVRANSPELSDWQQGELKEFDSEELSQLVYLHAALHESLRLFPPAPFGYKSVLQPEVLPTGDAVQPGTKILIPLYTMARMESIWGKDCLEFKPERWIAERGKLKFEPSYKFMSFNSGPRICLGKEVAFTQMKSVVAGLLFNFHFQVLAGHSVTPTLSIILQMEKGLMVRVKQRETHMV
ncbi:alkane hydroxylase MAH1-like protein [Cinnamomum micranthum f. kanehirae]|uniref:Alkane hydroxylase MAH1-like protein n=1 Tax=Cinnamomum micranthum f. kanehirae TaxID=337451 RepID=A0A3S3M6T4_9MAGN|nr:alkane hydroxylase MAH1-like protein [Cinnamomum micranthum f. kanehirae]